MKPKCSLVIACGNPARGDDGLGPAFIERLAVLNRPDVVTDVDYQLNIEDAVDLVNYDRVLFVDASVSAPEPFQLQPLEPASEITFTSHQVSPGSVLAICHDHFRHAPEAWVMGIRGYQFDLGTDLSPAARTNLDAAYHRVLTLLDDWKRSDSAD